MVTITVCKALGIMISSLQAQFMYSQMFVTSDTGHLHVFDILILDKALLHAVLENSVHRKASELFEKSL